MPFYVIFLHGPVASGKHTIGALVSLRLGVPLFHNHLTVDLVRTLFEFGTEPFVRLREEVWLASFAAAARVGRSFVFTFNPEATVDPDLIGRLHRQVAAAGGRTHYVELVRSEDEIVRRLGDPGRAKFGKLIDVELYRQIQQHGGFDFPSLPEPLVTIDTETVTPKQAAAVIEQAMRAL